ncbi:MAG: putative binding protein component of iron transporter precursor [Hyphomicrobiales bacterium]|nr:putative binding protein component of iron transporter precursor [Hyphomicrobiales bacterium]
MRVSQRTCVAFLAFALLHGSARAADEALIAAAKNEGAVVWYTTQIIDPLVLAMNKAFQSKYGIRIDYVRANSGEIVLRLVNEARAGKVQADVYDGTTTAEALKKEGLALQWLPDEAKSFPADYRDQDGYWVATNFYVITAAYNTTLVPAGTEPRSWDDLLDPKWRGQIAWGGTPSISGAAGFIGIVLKEWGEEKGRAYLKKLSEQRIGAIAGSARTVIDQAIAGEYAIALQVFPEHAFGGAKKGAPIRWIPMRPGVSTVVSTTGVTKAAPHPNAGKLLLDFLISEEGQNIYRDAFYIPAHPNVKPIEPELAPSNYHAIFLTPAEANEKMPKWLDVQKEMFR